MTIKCSFCGVEKNESEFYKNCRSKTGYKSYCKDCQKERYREQNKIRNKRNYQKNLEENRRKARGRRDKNKEARRARYNERAKDNKEYNIFRRTYYSLRRRCNNPHDVKYPRYGGRGIKCLWKTFKDFYNDMYDGFIEHTKEYGTGRKNCQIDRIDNDGHYCKENCRWVTAKENNSYNHEREFSS